MIVLVMNKIKPHTLVNYLEYVVFDDNKEVLLHCSAIDPKGFYAFFLANYIDKCLGLNGFFVDLTTADKNTQDLLRYPQPLHSKDAAGTILDCLEKRAISYDFVSKDECK